MRQKGFKKLSEAELLEQIARYEKPESKLKRIGIYSELIGVPGIDTRHSRGFRMDLVDFLCINRCGLRLSLSEKPAVCGAKRKFLQNF